MSWERRLLDLFDDLEQQAEGLALATRDAAVGELGRAGYAEVELAARLHASIGLQVQLDVRGAGPLRGRLVRAGSGWCLLSTEPAPQERLVSLSALVSARGLSSRAVPESVRGVVTRLGIGSLLRSLAESGDQVVIVTVTGEQRPSRVLRVGADFVEVLTDKDVPEVLPFAGVAVVHRR